MHDRSKPATVGPWMYARLDGTDVPEADPTPPWRKAGAVFLALLFVASTPLYWAASALGEEGSSAPLTTSKIGRASCRERV
jgi:hypothetical protein